MKKHTIIHLFNSGVFIILVAAITTFLLSQISLLEPINDSVTDWDFTDLYYKNNTDYQKVSIDTNIVIVNIGHLNRAEIGDLLNEINANNPKVVGVDVFFRKENKVFEDSILELALVNTKNLVMVGHSEKDNLSSTGFSVGTSHKRFIKNANIGLSNLIPGVKNVTRSFFAYEGDVERVYSFSSEILKYYDFGLAEEIIDRDYSEVFIKYQGSMANYRYIDYDESKVLQVYNIEKRYIGWDWIKVDQDLSIVKDKIVLFGYVGRVSNSINDYIEDLYNTPLRNENSEFKIPDMYGVAILANTISMYLNKNSVNAFLVWQIGYNWLILFLFILLLQIIHSKFKPYNQFIDRGISLLIIYLLIQISVTLFSYGIYFNFTLAVFWLLFATDADELYRRTYEPIYENLSIIEKKIFLIIPLGTFLLALFFDFILYFDFVENQILFPVDLILLIYFIGFAVYGFVKNKKSLN